MRTDAHVHLDRIGGIHRTEPPTVDEFRGYVAEEDVDTVGAIYEEEDTIERFKTPGVDLIPIFWERSPGRPRIPGRASAIKLHPFLDSYPLEPRWVRATLEVARDRRLPVLIHSEDRRPELSRGRQVSRLCTLFPEVTFIIAHSGSYAPGIEGQPGMTTISERRVRELVGEAVDAANEHGNVYLEVSILASEEKTRVLAARAPLDRVLIGSDFPIGKGTYGSVRFQEEALHRAGLSWGQIDMIRGNVRRLFCRPWFT